MVTAENFNAPKRTLPPCRAACPADVNVQGYVALIQQGKFKEAVTLIRKNMPFPAICGRVCFSPCQDACIRKDIDNPVGVRYLKRLAADIEFEQGRIKPTPIPKIHTEKVAIIGAGPAGLSAAYELARLGYPVTVFERMQKCGGMMMYGIPNHRLQKYVVANEIAYIEDLGVEIKTGVEFGKDINLEYLRRDSYTAVFITIGAQASQELGIPGEDLEGVFHAVEFLRDLCLEKPVAIGETVVVIGGGNSAIDAARTSLRLGAKTVTILYRRSRREMPALPYEIEAAEEEGIRFEFLVSPIQIIGDDGRVKAVECLRMKLGEPDTSGRRRPIPIENSEHTYDIETVIVAVGQQSEATCLPPILLDERGRRVQVDPVTLETSIPSVFAGGDVATGPASVIEAVGAGRRAAVSIDRYLKGKDLRSDREPEVEETTWVRDIKSIKKKPERYTIAPTDIGRLSVSFEDADRLLAKTKKDAVLESRRCLECGPCEECLEREELCDADKAVVDENLCSGCNTCVLVCPFDAIEKNELGIAQVNETLCKGCGICSATCPERAISMKKFSDVQILASVVSAVRGKVE
ncbi:MAG: FAD-dependent oxidoreductase [Candidatus Bathyarchaeota archaeon]|nr:FAD-dependent oxidoreductase [Candidatus Bathyarchaeota archaeon]